jgi:hypothetical protein
MAYDGARKLVVLFGGLTASGERLNDTWEWDGEVWTQVADTGPIPRWAHAITFDSVHQRIVLFGGYSPVLGLNIYLNDTWEWDGEVWTQVADTGPIPRAAHAITFDSVRQRVVLFGGYGGGADPLNDTWEWDGAVWTQVADTGPSPRMEHAVTFDSVRQRVVLFGGTTMGGPVFFFNDTWEWDGAVWTQIADTGPSPRGFPTMAQMGTRTALFGGHDGVRLLADTWEWKDLRWTQRQDMGPPNRAGHGMAYDGQRERAVLFGGIASNSLLGDTWELALNQPI